VPVVPEVMDSVRCAACGKVYSEDVRHCPVCGRRTTP
jgi:rRNA maturation endonuclease Nob1